MTHDIFISHSSKDKPIADAICANLEGAGIRCWIAPRDIAPGEDWPTAITRAISQSRVMVLVFSAHSNSSEDVSRELFLAANSKLVIIPFKIEDIEPEPGKQYYLARTHWLDAINPPTQEQIRALIDCVQALLPVRETPPVKTQLVDQTLPGNEPPKPPLPQPVPGKKAARLRYFWIPAGTLLLLGLIGWIILTFITHTLPAPMLAWGTATTTAAKTIPASMTPTISMTPTPNIFAAKVDSITKLYEGPGEYYLPIQGFDMVAGDVTIVGQAFTCDWLEVTSSNTGDTGWLSADKVTYTAKCPDIPAIKLTKSGCALTSVITISNSTGAEAILSLVGNENFTFYLQPDLNSVRVCAGTYSYQVQEILAGCPLCYMQIASGSVAGGQEIFLK